MESKFFEKVFMPFLKAKDDTSARRIISKNVDEVRLQGLYILHKIYYYFPLQQKYFIPPPPLLFFRKEGEKWKKVSSALYFMHFFPCFSCIFPQGCGKREGNFQNLEASRCVAASILYFIVCKGKETQDRCR